MEDFELDIVIGQGPGARSVKVPVEPFTLVGATTRAGLLTAPLRARFGIVQRLDFYTVRGHRGDRPAIRAHSRRRRWSVTRRSEMARRSRGTPRIANRLLRRVRDYAQVRADGRVTPEVAVAAMELLEVDAARLRRSRSAAAADDHRQIRRRPGRPDQPGRGDQRRARRHRGHSRAVSDSTGISRAHAARPRGDAACLRVLRPADAGKGTVLRAEIKSLATYVPPRLLTNADLEKLVETSNDWIMQRTGIRERHVVDPGVATSDLATEAARSRDRARRPDARPTSI